MIQLLVIVGLVGFVVVALAFGVSWVVNEDGPRPSILKAVIAPAMMIAVVIGVVWLLYEAAQLLAAGF